jgi:hypothetical protein
VAVARTDDSKGSIVTIISVTGISQLGTALIVTSNRSTLRTSVPSLTVITNSSILFTLMMEAIRSSGKSVLTRATQRHISGDDIVHSHPRENLKFSITID